MRKAILCGSVALLLAAVVWAGGEPWKTKPYQQWDAKDVRRVLDSSPWARAVDVDAPWKGGDAEGGGSDGSSAATPPGASRPGQGGGGRPGSGASNLGAGSQVALARFVVRWSSSRTIREAILRAAILAGEVKEDAAAQQLGQPAEAYELVVAGPDMKPFQSVDEKILENGTFLINKKTKQKISPTSVQIKNSDDGKTIQSVAFFFPKKTESGISTIAADEKTVDFSCVVTNVKIEASFDTTKMLDSEGRDL